MQRLNTTKVLMTCLLALTGSVPAGSGLAGAQRLQAPDSGAFVTVLGNDTIAIERYVRTERRLQIEAVRRDPQTRVLQLVVAWDENGRLTGYDLTDSPAPGSGGPARIRSIANVQGDTLTIEVTQRPNQPRLRRIRMGADIPWISPFYSLYETAILRARAEQPSALSMLDAQGLISYQARWSANGVDLTLPIGVMHAELDASGKVRVFDGAATTYKVHVDAIPWPDLDAFAARYARLPLGILSTRDTARVVTKGAVVLIDYGRPAARGRIIFGRVVPWDRVWRTGANLATHFETTGDLLLFGLPLAAGRYTLWTIPGPDEWQLIINKQTGQWGTEYDERQNLMRIPMRVRGLDVPIERFTITLERRSDGGTIRMAWDKTEAAIDFVVK